jgi:hypothetical protein
MVEVVWAVTLAQFSARFPASRENNRDFFCFYNGPYDQIAENPNEFIA